MSIGNIVVPNPAKWWEFVSYLRDKKINMSNGNITVPNPAKSGNELLDDDLVLVKLFVNLLFNFVFDSLLSWTPALHWVEIIS